MELLFSSKGSVLKSLFKLLQSFNLQHFLFTRLMFLIFRKVVVEKKEKSLQETLKTLAKKLANF